MTAAIRVVKKDAEELQFPRVYGLGLVRHILEEVYNIKNFEVVPPALGGTKLEFQQRAPVAIQPASQATPANLNLHRQDPGAD